MKTNFKLLIIAILIACANPLFSQESRFIEVASSDTIVLKPIGFIYKISFETKYEVMGYSFPIKGNDSIPPPPLADVKKVLTKNNFNFEISDQKDYVISKDAGNDTTILVTLKTETDLKNLIKVLTPLKGIAGKIKEVKYESSASYNTEMYKTLYTRALSDATTIAKVSGNTIGKLISTEEVKDSFFDYFSNYNELLKDLPYYKDKDNLNKTIIRKLIFKFQML